ncbi:MAG: hypothetical protein OSA97_13130 [Nevskia sp.]|nr:hypothetical protein [Nevskia sp.]
MPLVAIPRAEIQMVVRFSGPARNGLDIHAFGAQHRARRKMICAGQRSITIRLTARRGTGGSRCYRPRHHWLCAFA